jgi:hypothetical protein
MRLRFPRILRDNRRTIAIAGAVAGVGIATYVILRPGKKKGLGPMVDGFAGVGGTGQDGENPPRWPLWGPVHTVQDELVAPGWYADVLTGSNDNFACNATSLSDALAKGDKHGSYFDCKDLTGKGDPQPLTFRIRLGPLDEPRIVRAEVTIVDVDGVTNATRWRTNKKTSGRKNGNLDVNEYWFEGPRDETCYREVLARRFDGIEEGPYLVRRRDPCSPKTNPQPYHLYRAQREVTLKGWFGTTREWFAKIANGTPYPIRSAIPNGKNYVAQYDLSLGVDAQGVFVDGVVAASLPSMPLRVTIQWATRPG